MKTHLILMAVFALLAVANKVQAQPASLEEVMKSLDDEVKVISAQLDNRQQNSDSAERSLKIRKLFIVAFQFIPPKLEKLPEAERAALLRTYDKFLAQEISLTSDLEGNFAANENDKAKLTFAEIGKVKREAHKLFK